MYQSTYTTSEFFCGVVLIIKLILVQKIHTVRENATFSTPGIFLNLIFEVNLFLGLRNCLIMYVHVLIKYRINFQFYYEFL